MQELQTILSHLITIDQETSSLSLDNNHNDSDHYLFLLEEIFLDRSEMLQLIRCLGMYGIRLLESRLIQIIYDQVRDR